ncbi:hypothetical protein B6U70_00945 [Euryarchaeota archaeon ex4484_162]|nr:MAG: hypothetical protein B6U70_00945 [Euryarchaeota archaeon ex4484_162]
MKRYDKYLPPLTIFYEITYFIVLFYFGNRISLFFGGLLMLFGLLFTERGKKLSKKIVCFKSIYTSFSWSLLTFFTILYHSCQINAAALIFFIFIFLRLMIDTIFFDIKDIESDKKEGLLTLPIIFNNRKNLSNFLVFLNFISFVPIVVGVLTKTLPLFSLFLLPLIFYSLYYIQKAKSRETDIHFLSYILVDGEYYYWPFLLFIGTMFIN